MKKRNPYWIGVLVVLLAAPVFCLAQDGPPPRQERGEGPPLGRRGEMGEPPRAMRGFGGDMPTDEQWEEASAFMAEHSQRRWAAIQSLADEQMPLRRRVWGRYRAMQQLKQDNRALYETRLKQLQLEDEVFGLVEDMKASDSTEKRDKLRGQIRQLVSAWISKGLDERQQRLDRLEQMIKDERARLEKDKARVDALVDERMKSVVSHGADALHPEGGPPPEHGERRGRPGPPRGDGPPREGPRESPEGNMPPPPRP